MEPETISKLVGYFIPGQTNMTFNTALFYASLMIGLRLLQCFYVNNYTIYLYQLAVQMKIAFCSAVYRKALKMSPRALKKISLGKSYKNVIICVTKQR